WAGPGAGAGFSAGASRLLLAGRGDGEGGTLDHERERREYRGFPGSGAGALEELRRKNNFGVSVPPAGKICRETAGADRHSRRTGGAIASGLSGPLELFRE